MTANGAQGVMVVAEVGPLVEAMRTAIHARRLAPDGHSLVGEERIVRLPAGEKRRSARVIAVNDRGTAVGAITPGMIQAAPSRPSTLSLSRTSTRPGPSEVGCDQSWTPIATRSSGAARSRLATGRLPKAREATPF